MVDIARQRAKWFLVFKVIVGVLLSCFQRVFSLAKNNLTKKIYHVPYGPPYYRYFQVAKTCSPHGPFLLNEKA